jgi:hypothetical protein
MDHPLPLFLILWGHQLGPRTIKGLPNNYAIQQSVDNPSTLRLCPSSSPDFPCESTSQYAEQPFFIPGIIRRFSRVGKIVDKPRQEDKVERV